MKKMMLLKKNKFLYNYINKLYYYNYNYYLFFYYIIKLI